MSAFSDQFTVRILLLVVLLAGLAGCGVDNSASPPAATTSGSAILFSGSVGDGPITGAALRVFSARGNRLGTIYSDSRAKYQANITPVTADFPLWLETSGGIDLVTGRAPDFEMISVLLAPGQGVANLNPFSTLMVLMTEKMPGGVTAGNLDRAHGLLMDAIPFGLDPSAVPNPVTTAITTRNVAQIVKASEMLGEVVRRTRDNLQARGWQINGTTVMNRIAADLTDGIIDGAGPGTVNATVSALFNIASAQVLVEAMSNSLRVDGVVATGVIDQSIRTTSPGIADNRLTASVRITGGMLRQARIALVAAQYMDNDAELASLADAVSRLSAATPASVAAGTVPAGSGNILNAAVYRASIATSSQSNAVNRIVYDQTTATGGSSGSGSSGGSSGGGGTGNSDPGTSTGTTGGGSAGGGQTSGSVTLNWTAPVTRTDGAPLTLADIGGYRIYYGNSAGNLNDVHQVTDRTATRTTISGLSTGTWYLQMSTTDSAGREGPRSGKISRQVN